MKLTRIHSYINVLFTEQWVKIQWVDVLLVKPDNPSSVSGYNTVEKV